MILRRGALLAVVALSCTPAPVAVAPATSPKKIAPKPSTILLPPLTPATPADWLETTSAAEEDRDRTPDAYGMKAALYKQYAVHEDYGVVGPITWPSGDKFHGLDGEDAVWVGTESGLLRAQDVRAARAGAFKNVLPLTGGRAFTATKGLVAATDGKAVFITRNGGKTFTKKIYPTMTPIESIAARPDGVLAIAGHQPKDGGIWLTKWGETPTLSLTISGLMGVVLPELSAHGAILLASHGCSGAVLGADQKTWFYKEDYTRADQLAMEWAEPFATSVTPARFERNHATLVEPSAPMAGTPTTEVPECTAVAGFGRPHGVRRTDITVHDCSFAACVKGTTDPAPKPTATRAAFYSDGACEDRGDGDDPCSSWKRTPQVWHSRVPDPLSIPKDCTPERLLSAGGIGLLVCLRDNKRSLYTIDKDGRFHAEGGVASGWLPNIHIAEDGTILLSAPCSPEKCAPAAVRAPRPLGDASAWRLVTVADPLAYRVLHDGNVLVITGKGSKMSLWIDRPGEAPLAFASDVELPGNLYDVTVKADKVSLTIINRSMWTLTDQGLAPPASTE